MDIKSLLGMRVVLKSMEEKSAESRDYLVAGAIGEFLLAHGIEPKFILENITLLQVLNESPDFLASVNKELFPSPFSDGHMPSSDDVLESQSYGTERIAGVTYLYNPKTQEKKELIDSEFSPDDLEGHLNELYSEGWVHLGFVAT